MVDCAPKETDLKRVLLENIPLLDVRAPVEFNAGAFPESTNIPLLTDEERHLIGIRYKTQGQDAAIALGYALVDKQQKQQRIARWAEFFQTHPNGMLYCFRGGLRSRLTQRMLMDEAGITVPRIVGGYKAMRRFLLDRLQADAEQAKLVVLGGRTGTGKTVLLHQCERFVDLEGIAHHKGSAFGQELEAQPPQISIDNEIAIALMRNRVARPDAPIMLEDEGSKIGARSVPPPLWEAMQKAPLVVLHTPVEKRIEQVFEDYITSRYQKLIRMYGREQAEETLKTNILQSLDSIKKRLELSRHKDLSALALTGLNHYFASGDKLGIESLIEQLLIGYYDPMYDYQINKKKHRIVFQGTETEIRDWWFSTCDL
ncbi:tRNA 2-selenouridine(34) synthase MnmH [Halothiobacillus sp.]|uniref:tRNA 2-selenouridine(34) synthase MnmH n=1 Tax=Halothiobacillus sp. TaxID=1891311 RepID=UPI003D0ED0B2